MHFQLNIQKAYRAAAVFFENGEMAVTLPTAAPSGCGFGSLKCETDKSTERVAVGGEFSAKLLCSLGLR